MTRDNPRLVDDNDANSDIFSALWQATPSSAFPKLPDDAPQELRRLTIDVDNPKRVYTIYRASRRHNFQILVERFILQLRYGCQTAHCSTPTCFTCRLRAAGANPIRRYNSTSARTLACYLASQDNPESGLCPHLNGPYAKPALPVHIGFSSKSNPEPRDDRSQQKCPRVRVHGGTVGSEEQRHDGFKSHEGNGVSHTTEKEQHRSTVDLSEGPIKTDHKSFIQNLFNTDAMRMLEWLTPNNLGALSSRYAELQKLLSGSPTLSEVKPETKIEPVEATTVRTTEKVKSDSSSSLPKATTKAVPKEPQPLEIFEGSIPLTNKAPNDGTHSRSGSPKFNRRRQPHRPLDATPPSSPISMRMNGRPTGRDSRDTYSGDPTPPKSRPLGKFTDIDSQKRNSTETVYETSFDTVEVSRRRTSLGSESPTTELKHDLSLSSLEIDGAKNSGVIIATEELNSGGKVSQPCPLPGRVPPKGHVNDEEVSQEATKDHFPQSLSTLSAEASAILLKIIKTDESFDFLSHLSASSLQASLEKNRLFGRKEKSLESKTADTMVQWRNFTDQSLFYVLSNPSALLNSFTESNGILLDTYSLSIFMTRLCRLGSPLVLESLWIAANDLYIPPEELWEIYNWAPSSWAEKADMSDPYTSKEASNIISVCLHALIAVIPDSDQADQFEVSRLRSTGLSSQRPKSSHQQQSKESLDYDDVFSDELALRLARRVFAAIPVRRQYQELLDSKVWEDLSTAPKTDILDAVLDPLNFLEIETPSVIVSTPEDRKLHERRAPTLLIDWARTILMQDWNGRAEVPCDGPFGGALALITAIYGKRKSLLLGDIHFRTEYFADRLDATEVPLEWLSFTPSRKTVHLLDYPYLFSPSTLVTYFRAINYSRMNRAFETAGAILSHVQSVTHSAQLIPEYSRREELFKSLEVATSQYLVLHIRRTNVLEDAFNYIWRREERELLRPLKVRLGEDGGEEGSDSGGVQQEFFRLAIAEALDPRSGAFTIDERTQMTWFQPTSPEPVWKFELIGLLFSLAIYNGLTLPITFPKALYRKLLGIPVTSLHDIQDGWPDLAAGLTQLLEWNECNGLVEDIFARGYEFSAPLFDSHISLDISYPSPLPWPEFHDLWRADPPASTSESTAPPVTAANRHAYVKDYIHHLTSVSIEPQFSAFQRGFTTCLDARSLQLLTPDLLQSLIEGEQHIDVTLLRRHARYIGFPGDGSNASIRDFWAVVRRFDQASLRRLLEFVTASDRIPVGGISNLQFVIQRNGGGGGGEDDDEDVKEVRLPTSYTCYGTLLLPEYKSREVLKEKLLMALENAKGFGFA